MEAFAIASEEGVENSTGLVCLSPSKVRTSNQKPGTGQGRLDLAGHLSTRRSSSPSAPGIDMDMFMSTCSLTGSILVDFFHAHEYLMGVDLFGSSHDDTLLLNFVLV